MTTIQRATVVGVFENRIQAENALNDLHHAGFSDDDIGFAVRDMSTTTDATPETIQRETAAGAATGAVSGGVVGGILGAAAALLIPGLGPALAGGILAVTLGGAALGAVAGSFAGALTGFGVPEEEAIYYQSELEMGRIIATVKAPDRYQEAFEILHRNGAYDASTRNSGQQNVPPYDPNAPVAGTYDPGIAVKGPALVPPEYVPETVAGTSEAQSEAYSSTSRQYDRLADAEVHEGDGYNRDIPGGSNR